MNLQPFQEQLNRIERTVSTLKNVLTFDDVCTLTKLSKSHLYKLTAGKKIPHYKPTGKQLYFDRTEVERWLLTNKIKSNDEIASEAESYMMNKRMKGGK